MSAKIYSFPSAKQVVGHKVSAFDEQYRLVLSDCVSIKDYELAELVAINYLNEQHIPFSVLLVEPIFNQH